jgi:predicted nicotinamide N-methyase
MLWKGSARRLSVELRSQLFFFFSNLMTDHGVRVLIWNSRPFFESKIDYLSLHDNKMCRFFHFCRLDAISCMVLLFSLEICLVQGFSPPSNAVPQAFGRRRCSRKHGIHTQTTSSDLYDSQTIKCLALHAKKSRPQGRGGRRDKPTQNTRNDVENHQDDGYPILKKTLPVVPLPSKTKRVSISLERVPPKAPLVIYAFQVDDPKWWQNVDNINPFGARCWPSSLAVAQFLVLLRTGSLDDRQVLELGCGTGLPSLAAACCGANVVASDISPFALSLMRQGWKETTTSKRRPVLNKDDDTPKTTTGTLTTIDFDLCSSLPLPLVMEQRGDDSTNNTLRAASPIVIAAAMMYEADLAQALARRLMEACALGAWVILGDDDTGERDGGRASFMAEFARLEDELLLSSTRSNKVARVWTDVTVKNMELGWREKQVRLLHLNPPPGILSESVKR